MTLPPLLTAPLVVVGVALLARLLPPVDIDSLSARLESPRAPALLGLLSAAALLYVWGTVDPVAVVHDERAYLLQAEIFSHFRWTAPPPPLPQFFEQMHVLVEPRLASKYLPGHSLLLTPGVWLGMPGLMPLVLAGLSGALVFVLLRRVAGAWPALLGWMIWTFAPGNLYWRASFYSESTTCAAMLVAYWAMLRWRDDGRRRHLVLLAVALAWGAITRPVTMLAIGAPIGAVVLRWILQRRAWRDFAMATVAGLLVLGIEPLWAARTTGDWRTSPLMLYTKQYVPWDVPGFGLDMTPPTRPLPPDLESTQLPLMYLHQEHVPRKLPKEFRAQADNLMGMMWQSWRNGFVLFAAAGLLALSAEVAFALVSALLVFLAYGSYAHPSDWTLYYLEMFPALAAVTALGLWRVCRWVMDVGGSADEAVRRRRLALAACALVIAGLQPTANVIELIRANRKEYSLRHRYFRDVVAARPEPKSIVFVRYSPRHNGHMSLVGNVADTGSARAIIAYDRGDENARLMALFPDRVPLLYDERSLEIVPLARPAGSVAAAGR